MVHKIRKKKGRKKMDQKILMVNWLGKKTDDTEENVISVGILVALTTESLTITSTLSESGTAVGAITIPRVDIVPNGVFELGLVEQEEKSRIIMPNTLH